MSNVRSSEEYSPASATDVLGLVTAIWEGMHARQNLEAYHLDFTQGSLAVRQAISYEPFARAELDYQLQLDNRGEV